MSVEERTRVMQLDRAALGELQLARLRSLLGDLLPHNAFYAAKLGDTPPPLAAMADLARLPLTTKDELIAASPGDDLAGNLTWPVERYVRFHRTSGTHGRPLVVLDTAEDWRWWVDVWQWVLDAAAVTPADRVLMAFSFGPFIGFWSAFEAVAARGAMVIPSGGLSTLARCELIRTARATVIFSTPSYMLHLAEVATEQGLDPASLGLRQIIVAGEPGGSVPAVRERIEGLFQARLLDHAGATEVGPWGYSDGQRRGLLVNEHDFLVEFRSHATGQPAGEGELAEMIVTGLGRVGCPVIRYRTGDLVRPRWEHDDPCRFVLLDGGVLGRADDMLVVRGVNIFPSSLDQILREFPEVAEYRITASRAGHLDQLAIEVEDRAGRPERIAQQLELRLGLKIAVRCVPPGSLPRTEGKGKRFVDQRKG